MIKVLYVLFFFLLLDSHASSQQSFFKGKVVDVETKEPLPFASIYFNSTTNGVSSDEEGLFSIPVDSLFTELIISFIGYKTISYQVDINDLNKRYVFSMVEERNMINEVEVVSKRGQQWYNNLRQFENNFIGTSSIARKSKIINPEVLQFDYDKKSNILIAKAKEPIIIENPILGYRIEYSLENFYLNYQSKMVSFIGYPRFIEMEGKPKKKKKWAKERKKAYNGSLQHFFKSIYNSTVKEEGFSVRKYTRTPNSNRPSDESILQARQELKNRSLDKIKRDSLLRILDRKNKPKMIATLEKQELDCSSFITSKEKDQIKLTFKDFWYVIYKKEKADQNYRPPGKLFSSNNQQFDQISIISVVKDEIVFNKEGIIIDPLSIFLEQYWSFEKVGDILPLDYRFE